MHTLFLRSNSLSLPTLTGGEKITCSGLKDHFFGQNTKFDIFPNSAFSCYFSCFVAIVVVVLLFHCFGFIFFFLFAVVVVVVLVVAVVVVVVVFFSFFM